MKEVSLKTEAEGVPTSEAIISDEKINDTDEYHFAYFIDSNKEFCDEIGELEVGSDGVTPYLPDRWSKRFNRIRRELGYKFRLHDLRHFMATQLIGAGVDIRTVSGRLGHANTSTTLNIYSHFLEARDEEASQIMDTILS